MYQNSVPGGILSVPEVLFRAVEDRRTCLIYFASEFWCALFFSEISDNVSNCDFDAFSNDLN